MGSVKGGKEIPSELKRASVRRNATRARGAQVITPVADTRADYQLLTKAKHMLRTALCEEGARRMCRVIRDPGTPWEVFLDACKFAAGRVGLAEKLDVEIDPATQIGMVQIIIRADVPKSELAP